VSVLRHLIHVLAPQTCPRLWEPGYRERYYQQKFAVEFTDQEFKKKYDILFVTIGATFILHPGRITTHYIEGLAWVLAYYYQGVRYMSTLTTLLSLISNADTFMAMVLSFPFRSFCRRFRRGRQNGHTVRAWQAFPTL
jgi:hypothetical protein